MTEENILHTPEAGLWETLAKYEIEIPDPVVEQLDQFCRLEWSWNEKVNLTRHTTYQKFVTRDLLDTLALSEFLAPGERVMDVGSGGGVPGILLAILRPDITVALAECVAKKAKILMEIVDEMRLPVYIFGGLGQDVLGNYKFHTLTFRAVASMKKILEWFRQDWDHFDRMLLVKGPRWINERGEARHYNLLRGLALRKLKEYTIPDMICEEKSSSEPEENENASEKKLSENRNGENLLIPSTLTEEGAKSFILQICPEKKLMANDLCRLSSWETAKSRDHRKDRSRRKNRTDDNPERL
ncbi:MAG: class I SAM-dependent methyltransferase [Planctomycetia bacterium]|nr:class I SAM-dependent methyltransferase [Planctomycetia bacterium]